MAIEKMLECVRVLDAAIKDSKKNECRIMVEMVVSDTFDPFHPEVKIEVAFSPETDGTVFFNGGLFCFDEIETETHRGRVLIWFKNCGHIVAKVENPISAQRAAE